MEGLFHFAADAEEFFFAGRMSTTLSKVIFIEFFEAVPVLISKSSLFSF